jgi:hypothetical protein
LSNAKYVDQIYSQYIGQQLWKTRLLASIRQRYQIRARWAIRRYQLLSAKPQDIVIARVYVVDLTPERMEEVMPPFLATFEGAQPSVTGLGVAALASPELQVEMELVVRLPN